MYKYKRAVCLSRSIGLTWEEPDLENTPLCSLFSKYLHTYIVVHEVIIDKDINVDMETYRTEYSASCLTVAQWLDSMVGKTLNTVKDLPSDNLAYARYENAVLRNYQITPTKAGYQYPPEIPVADLPDLALTRDMTDITKLHTHCMMSVNGYFHRTDTDGIAGYILDGNVTAMKKRCSHTGILSFLNIGKITQYQFLDEDIIPLNEDGDLKDGIILRLPEEYREQSKIFVFGGYILQPDRVAFISNSDDTYVLYPKALPLLERYLESRDELDLSSIIVEAPLGNKDNAILTSDIFSDDNLRAWLKLSQSFVAVIDTPVLYYNQINVRVSNLPGFITAYQEPMWPLIMGYGKHVEYSKIAETQYWALRIQDPFYKQFTFQKAPIRVQPVVSDQFIPWKPYLRTQGYLLEISGAKKPYN